ncbi:MAG: hypothetical protein HXY23_08800 [Parvularculaceae bacterium]|jgi:hypothetical protein|nr:hypothetical protein [Parvularculaceae bacterium]
MTASRQHALRARTALALRRFNAWWEGYAFNAALEAAEIERRLAGAFQPSVDVPQLIWGRDRDEPGDPAWTMRHARALGLGARSRVMIFGAGGGAVLRDARAGARWQVSGLARSVRRVRGLDLKSYDETLGALDRQSADGALVFFELHRDGDPGAFARYCAEFLKPGAPVAVIDYALARADARARAVFDGPLPGAPRLASDYVRILRECGFSTSDVADETRLFLPLVSRGWTNWRRAYEAARAVADARARAEAMRYLAAYADAWADRFEALKAGTLAVTRILARRL